MVSPSLRSRSLALPRGPSRPLLLLLLLGLAALLILNPTARPLSTPTPAVNFDFGKLPLSFTPNVGQTEPAVKFQVHDMGGTIFFTSSEAVLALPATTSAALSVLHLRFEGANPASTVVGADPLPGIANYFVGDDPAMWHTELPTYAAIVYRQLYPGIDLRYDGTSGQLKGTYTLAPGADPSLIRWRHVGAAGVRLTAATGHLLISMVGSNKPGQDLIERAPVAWQDIDGRRIPVTARYVLADDGLVGLALGKYDRTKPLTIDPTLIYSTYLGGSSIEDAQGIAVDVDGNAIVTGSTSSSDFPTANSFDGTDNDGDDVYVAKISATGDALLYSTYIGGRGGDRGGGVAVDQDGYAYVTGATNSTDFPTQNPLQSSKTGLEDAFVLKLSPDGTSLIYSTYLGGSHLDDAQGIAVDGEGNATVTGSTFSSNFPTQDPLYAAHAGGWADGYVAQLNASGSALVYSTYLGGSGTDSGMAVVVDGAGNAYVTGETTSTDFPTQDPYQSANNGWSDIYVAALNADGSDLIYATYLGGAGKDYVYDIAVDSAGNAHVTGQTESSDFPTTPGAFDTECGTDGDCNNDTPFYTYGDAFVAKLNDSGSDLLYSTYLGGSDLDKGGAIAVDGDGNATVTGDTNSDDFPTEDPMQGYGGDADAFLLRLSSDGSGLIYSTYLGGSTSDYGTGVVVDDAGDAYVAGITFSDDFPVEAPLYDTYRGTGDVFVAKISGEPSVPPAPGPNLRGSRKTVSRHAVVSGDTLSCTIELRNSGTVAATATVTDPLPEEIDYVDGSATEGGVYDPATRTLTWNDVAVGAGEAVSLSFQVTATTVDTPTLICNTATVAAGDDSFERHAWVLLMPTALGPDLRASYKVASQYKVESEETLTYTIRLHNGNTVAAVATVTDPVPEEMEYVTGSANEGGVYDPATETLTWSDVSVPAGDSLSLSFAVTANTVEHPTPVVNTATITTDGESFDRSAVVLVVPEPTAEDTSRPVVHSLTIDEQDVLTEPSVTLHISATDDVGLNEMYVREWQWDPSPIPRWRTVESSGWVPFQADYPWTLGEESGTHFVGVWVNDEASNLSRLNRNALDFASLLLPAETVSRFRIVPYQVYYEEDVAVTAQLEPSEGDPDLYVWYPDYDLWPPDQESTLPGSSTDEVSFTTPQAGTYLFLVYGDTAATYDFSITPGGGPDATGTTVAVSQGMGPLASEKVTFDKPPIQDLVSLLFASGLDPLGSPAAVGPFEMHLPIIIK